MVRGCTIVFLAFFLTAATAAGDVLVLDDGTRLSGDVERTARGYKVTAVDGEVTIVKAKRVTRIILGRDNDDEAKPADASPAERFDALRRQAETRNDLDAIIADFEAFVRETKDRDVAARAEVELAVWRGRRDRGEIRSGGVWVDPAAQADRYDAARRAIMQALQANTPAAAEALLNDPLTADAGNYLLGVQALLVDDAPTARRRFQAVRRTLPNHAPTLNNLAAIEANLGRPKFAVWFVSEALKAAPGATDVLDNAAELLHMLPRGEDVPHADRLHRLFAAQEPSAILRQGERGLLRWGSQWVEADEHARLDTIRRSIQADVDLLRADYDRHAREVRSIETTITSNEAYMRQLDRGRWYFNSAGVLVQGPLPRSFYLYQSRNAGLRAERQDLLQKMNELDRRAREEWKRLPRPLFLGRLKPIGSEGVPVQVAP